MPHPHEGDLRAYLDRELPPAAVQQLETHLRGCLACRRALAEARDRGDRVDALLEVAGVSSIRRTPRWAMAIAGVAAAAVVATFILRGEPATHSRVAGATRVQDVCCFNLDGGGPGDDGLLTVSRAGQIVDCVVLYEDRTGTRAFSPRDPVRFVSRPNGCDLADLHRAGS